MIKKLLILTLMFSISTTAVTSSKPNNSTDAERRLYELEHKLKIIDANQLNYKIEKNLLKETYSSNYKQINIIISIALAIIAVLGFLGLKDIAIIRKKYNKELNELTVTKNNFNYKSLEFEDEIKLIIEENNKQSQKIKFLELQEKIYTLYKSNEQLTLTLDLCNAALNIEPNHSRILNVKGSILLKLNQITDAVQAFKLSFDNNPEDELSKFNYVESLYFSNDTTKAQEIIDQNKILFQEKEAGKLLDYLKIIELYHKHNKPELLKTAKNYITAENLHESKSRLKNWNLDEAVLFITDQKESEFRDITQHILEYWNGNLTGKRLLSNLGIS